MKMRAPIFKSEMRCIKEFMDNDGKSYLVVCFQDGSAAVFQRKKATKEAIADYEPVENQKEVLRKLGATGIRGKTTYALAHELCGI